jgi:hypothetical protein
MPRLLSLLSLAVATAPAGAADRAGPWLVNDWAAAQAAARAAGPGKPERPVFAVFR